MCSNDRFWLQAEVPTTYRLRPLHLHKPTSGRPLLSLDLIGQEFLERAFFRSSVTSILDHQVTGID